MIRSVLPPPPDGSPPHASRPQRLGLTQTRILWAALLLSLSSARSASVNPALLIHLNAPDRHIVGAIPTFAGVYLNAQGVYTVALAGCGLPSQAAVLERYKTLIADAYGWGLGRLSSGVNFAFVQVKYSLAQLNAFRTTLEQQSDTLGLAAISLDYERNRVLVFTAPGQPPLDLPRVLIRLNLPSDAAEVWAPWRAGGAASSVLGREGSPPCTGGHRSFPELPPLEGSPASWLGQGAPPLIQRFGM